MQRTKGWLRDRGRSAQDHGDGHEEGRLRPERGEDGVLETGRHPVNVTHLVMGVAFLGIVAVWAVLTGGALDLDDAPWLVPVPFLAAGALGLVASVVAGARRRTGS